MGQPLPSREPATATPTAMDTGDWKTQLPLDARGKVVNKILETLKKQLPFSGPAGINELRRIATKFEERTFNCAINQVFHPFLNIYFCFFSMTHIETSENDYLRKISIKMLTMETKSQNAAGSSSFTPAANIGTSMDSGEPFVNTGDWRTQMPPDSRQKNANKIMETLKKHVPNSGLEGMNELMRIAVSFEELIFNTSLSQVDYFGKISFKILTVEEGN